MRVRSHAPRAARHVRQADSDWWHPTCLYHDSTMVPDLALFARLPHAPRFWEHMRAADAAIVDVKKPQQRRRLLPPYDDVF